MVRCGGRWLRRILKGCGAKWKEGVRDTRAIGRGLNTATAGGEEYRANLNLGVEYVCKGADGEVLLTLGRRHEPVGEIIGKRCGVSRNIDQTARSKARWRAYVSGKRTRLMRVGDDETR